LEVDIKAPASCFLNQVIVIETTVVNLEPDAHIVGRCLPNPDFGVKGMELDYGFLRQGEQCTVKFEVTFDKVGTGSLGMVFYVLDESIGEKSTFENYSLNLSKKSHCEIIVGELFCTEFRVENESKLLLPRDASNLLLGKNPIRCDTWFVEALITSNATVSVRGMEIIMAKDVIVINQASREAQDA
jgi:hypothetical protein